MTDIAFTMVITYPDDAHHPRTRESCEWIEKHVKAFADLAGFEVDWDDIYTGQTQSDQLTNRYDRKDIVILSRQVRHETSVPALVKLVDGIVDVLNIQDDYSISYSFLCTPE